MENLDQITKIPPIPINLIFSNKYIRTKNFDLYSIKTPKNIKKHRT